MQIPYTYPIWSYLFTPILREWATSLSVYDKQELYHQGSFQWDQGNNPYPCSTRIPASLVSWILSFGSCNSDAGRLLDHNIFPLVISMEQNSWVNDPPDTPSSAMKIYFSLCYEPEL